MQKNVINNFDYSESYESGEKLYLCAYLYTTYLSMFIIVEIVIRGSSSLCLNNLVVMTNFFIMLCKYQGAHKQFRILLFFF